MINEITNVSEITANVLADYLRISSPDEEELNELKTFLNISKEYIRGYTGVIDLDSYQDFIQVVLVLCQDMYDNRTLYVDKSNVNKVVESILNMHSTNYL